MSRFSAAPLDQLPPLPLAEPNFDAIRAARGAELARRLVEEGFGYDVESLETDPLTRAVARAGGVHEMLEIARRNDTVRSLMLATAWGAFLDHLGAGQTPPTARKPVVDTPRPFASFPEDWEQDDPYRRRIQLAPETLSTAGPAGSYLGYALATPGCKMAAVWGPMSFEGTRLLPFTPLGEVHVPIVATDGDGTASPALVAAVLAELRPKDRRPIADFVIAMAATIDLYRIEVVLDFVDSVDGTLFKPVAQARLEKRAARQHCPGAAMLIEQIKGACYLAGDDGSPLLNGVRVISPAVDINAVPITPATPGAAYRAPYCTEIVVRVEGEDG